MVRTLGTRPLADFALSEMRNSVIEKDFLDITDDNLLAEAEATMADLNSPPHALASAPV